MPPDKKKKQKEKPVWPFGKPEFGNAAQLRFLNPYKKKPRKARGN